MRRQDRGTVTVLGDGTALLIQNNAWKDIMIDYTVTSNTVIEFEFGSIRLGEIHGIGFDNDDGISSGFTFQLYGTQNWGNRNFKTYDTSGNWKAYATPVGQYFTGTFDRMTFVADHDVASVTSFHRPFELRFDGAFFLNQCPGLKKAEARQPPFPRLRESHTFKFYGMMGSSFLYSVNRALPAEAEAGFGLDDGAADVLFGDDCIVDARGKAVTAVDTKAEPLKEVKFQADGCLTDQKAIIAVSGEGLFRQFKTSGAENGSDPGVDGAMGEGRVGDDEAAVVEIVLGACTVGKGFIGGKIFPAFPSTVSDKELFGEFKPTESATHQGPVVSGSRVIVGWAAPGTAEVEVAEEGSLAAFDLKVRSRGVAFGLVGENGTISIHAKALSRKCGESKNTKKESKESHD